MSIDTLSLARELRAAEFEPAQAEAIAAAIGRAVVETAATKADFLELRAAMRADVTQLGTELRAEIGQLDVKIENVRSSLLGWFIATQVAVGGLIVALVKPLPV